MQAVKKALRKEIKVKLRAMSNVEKTRQSSAVAERLFANEKYKQSKRISVYLNMKNEVHTVEILQHALTSGKSVFIPKYVGSNMEMVKLADMRDYESLPETSWFIKQPLDEDNTREEAIASGGLDLIIVPGVGFTESGGRMGHGKGYYDTYISKIMAVKKPYLLGLAFNVQIFESIPLSDHDKQLDEVLFVE